MEKFFLNLTHFFLAAAYPSICNKERLKTEAAVKACEKLFDTLFAVAQWLTTLAGSLAVLFLVIGGIRYLAAAGNEAQIKKARSMIIYSVIGLILVIIAYAIVRTINSAL
jgi:hypothetical protein